jgi:hypothetical protein
LKREDDALVYTAGKAEQYVHMMPVATSSGSNRYLIHTVYVKPLCLIFTKPTMQLIRRMEQIVVLHGVGRSETGPMGRRRRRCAVCNLQDSHEEQASYHRISRVVNLEPPQDGQRMEENDQVEGDVGDTG